MITFVGLDLAWTSHRESGVCWLEGDRLDSLRCTRIEALVCDTESLAAEIAAIEGTVVVAIDAPLLYTPLRWAEREVARRFSRYKASPHQAHAAVRKGYTAGIDLGRALVRHGFQLDPESLLSGDRDGRFAVEVFPHTVHVRLFGLDERLPYKPKRGRSIAFRQAAIQRYQGYLRNLIRRQVPPVLTSNTVECFLAPETAASARGNSLKRLDDTLDGLTCALAALLLWREPNRWEMIGDLDGYIVVPSERDPLSLPSSSHAGGAT